MQYFPDYSGIVLQQLTSVRLSSLGVKIALLRLDRLHPLISGNKWFKLKYNLEAAKETSYKKVLTFGGVWSNHILSAAAACNLAGFNSVGIIRGENISTPTLLQAREQGMELHFISRENYRKKEESAFLARLAEQFGYPYIVPEGGDNNLGIKGCKEILPLCAYDEFTHICCAVGTGTTLAGLIESASPRQKIIGFPALKNADYLREKIADTLTKEAQEKDWQLIMDYHFGGFAKKPPVLIDFIKEFYAVHHIPLDLVYTAKMMYGIMDLTEKGYFPTGSKIVAIHTGGLQGNRSLPEISEYVG